MGIVNLLSTGKLGNLLSNGKTQIFQRLGFLARSALLYFACNRNPQNSENIGKPNSYSTGNVWENTNILKL